MWFVILVPLGVAWLVISCGGMLLGEWWGFMLFGTVGILGGIRRLVRGRKVNSPWSVRVLAIVAVIGVTFFFMGSWRLVGAIRLINRTDQYVQQHDVQTLISELDRLKGKENRERCIGALAQILQDTNLSSERFDLGIQYLYGYLNDPESADRQKIEEAIYLIAHERIIERFESSISDIANSADEVEIGESLVYAGLPAGHVALMQAGKLPQDLFVGKTLPDVQHVLDGLAGIAVIRQVDVKVGVYTSETSSNFMGKALQIHWHVAVVDMLTHKVVAVTHLVGSSPPDELKTEYGNPIDRRGDPPSSHSLQLWIESLERY
ncbi:hypothetical protein ACFL6U_01980 [Planctomycetota bacterium]